jgi:hypothetical protein
MVKVVPPARFGLATDGAAALIDNSQNGGKAQASSFAGLFRREERLEDMRPHLRVYSNPGVVHGHHHVAARRKLIRDIGLRQSHISRFNGQRTASGHRVSCV